MSDIIYVWPFKQQERFEIRTWVTYGWVRTEKMKRN